MAIKRFFMGEDIKARPKKIDAAEREAVKGKPASKAKPPVTKKSPNLVSNWNNITKQMIEPGAQAFYRRPLFSSAAKRPSVFPRISASMDGVKYEFTSI